MAGIKWRQSSNPLAYVLTYLMISWDNYRSLQSSGLICRLMQVAARRYAGQITCKHTSSLSLLSCYVLVFFANRQTLLSVWFNTHITDSQTVAWSGYATWMWSQTATVGRAVGYKMGTAAGRPAVVNWWLRLTVVRDHRQLSLQWHQLYYSLCFWLQQLSSAPRLNLAAAVSICHYGYVYHAENIWKRTHSALDWSAFKSLRNRYHNLILASKKQYYANLVS